MEPTIYKPGAYKTPGVYKGAGGIYKGRGVYNDGVGGDLSGFIFLTYFKDFVQSTGEDIPIKKQDDIVNGFQVYYTNSFIKSTFENMSSITKGAVYNSWTRYRILKDCINDIVSFEFICKVVTSTNDGCYIGFQGAEGNDDTSCATLIFRNTYTRIMVNKNSIVTGYNGVVYDYTGSRKGYHIPYDLNNTNVHFATVVNKLNGTIKIFVNGVLYISCSGGILDFLESPSLCIYYRSETSFFELTQVCVREGDLSINGGMNYPVPTDPYIPT